MMEQLLVSTMHNNEVDIRNILQQAIKNYFQHLIKSDKSKNLSDIVIIMDVDKDSDILKSKDRISGRLLDNIATVIHTERAFTITSKYLEDANIIDGSFFICLN
jgi:hypothetical protein